MDRIVYRIGTAMCVADIVKSKGYNHIGSETI